MESGALANDNGRIQFRATHRKFWKAVAPDRSAEATFLDVLKADEAGNSSNTQDVWRRFLANKTKWRAAPELVLQYVAELGALHSQRPEIVDFPTFYAERSLTELFPRMYGAILCGLTIKGDLDIRTGSSLYFLFLSGSEFSGKLRIIQSEFLGGVQGRGGKFFGEVLLDDVQIGSVGLDLNSVQESTRLVVKRSQVQRLNLGSSTWRNIEISDGVIQQEAYLSDLTVVEAFDLSATRFLGCAKCHRTRFLGQTRIAGDFAIFPEFYGASFSDQTQLIGISFNRRLNRHSGEADQQRRDREQRDRDAIRSLRIEVQKKRWVREEVKFFAEEQRADRMLMDLPSKAVEFGISWFYDVTSEYGASVTRVLIAFILVIVLSAILFESLFRIGPVDLPSFLSDYYFGFAPGALHVSPESPAAAVPGVVYALQNTFNPLAIFSEKALVLPRSLWVLVLGLIQSVLSLTLLALLILALRARFQRSGSSGSG
jgi:hypothetical protein